MPPKSDARPLVDETAHLLLSDPRWKAGFEERRRIMRPYHAGVNRATVLRPRTPEGVRAELALRDYENAGLDQPIIASVLNDIFGRA